MQKNTLIEFQVLPDHTSLVIELKSLLITYTYVHSLLPNIYFGKKT